jgi:hypothetical protein
MDTGAQFDGSNSYYYVGVTIGSTATSYFNGNSCTYIGSVNIDNASSFIGNNCVYNSVQLSNSSSTGTTTFQGNDSTYGYITVNNFCAFVGNNSSYIDITVGASSPSNSTFIGNDSTYSNPIVVDFGSIFTGNNSSYSSVSIGATNASTFTASGSNYTGTLSSATNSTIITSQSSFLTVSGSTNTISLSGGTIFVGDNSLYDQTNLTLGATVNFTANQSTLTLTTFTGDSTATFNMNQSSFTFAGPITLSSLLANQSTISVGQLIITNSLTTTESNLTVSTDSATSLTATTYTFNGSNIVINNSATTSQVFSFGSSGSLQATNCDIVFNNTATVGSSNTFVILNGTNQTYVDFSFSKLSSNTIYNTTVASSSLITTSTNFIAQNTCFDFSFGNGNLSFPGIFINQTDGYVDISGSIINFGANSGATNVLWEIFSIRGTSISFFAQGMKLNGNVSINGTLSQFDFAEKIVDLNALPSSGATIVDFSNAVWNLPTFSSSDNGIVITQGRFYANNASFTISSYTNNTTPFVVLQAAGSLVATYIGINSSYNMSVNIPVFINNSTGGTNTINLIGAKLASSYLTFPTYLGSTNVPTGTAFIDQDITYFSNAGGAITFLANQSDANYIVTITPVGTVPATVPLISLKANTGFTVGPTAAGVTYDLHITRFVSKIV